LKEPEYLFLPTATNNLNGEATDDEKITESEIIADSPCPCCGYITIPNHGDALAYICPVCFWEKDLFIKSENEPSDQNHGLTLIEAKKNYTTFGASLPHLKKY